MRILIKLAVGLGRRAAVALSVAGVATSAAAQTPERLQLPGDIAYGIRAIPNTTVAGSYTYAFDPAGEPRLSLQPGGDGSISYSSGLTIPVRWWIASTALGEPLSVAKDGSNRYTLLLQHRDSSYVTANGGVRTPTPAGTFRRLSFVARPDGSIFILGDASRPLRSTEFGTARVAAGVAWEGGVKRPSASSTAAADAQASADRLAEAAQRAKEAYQTTQMRGLDKDTRAEAQVELVKSGIDLIGRFLSDRKEQKRLEEEQARERSAAAYETRIAEMRALHAVECNFARDAIDMYVTSTSTAGKLDDGTCIATPNSARAVAYRFYVDSPGAHIIVVLTRDFQPKAILLDARGNPHLGFTDSEETEYGRKILKRVNIPRPGEYFLVVSGQGATTGTFAVQVNIPR